MLPLNVCKALCNFLTCIHPAPKQAEEQAPTNTLDKALRQSHESAHLRTFHYLLWSLNIIFSQMTRDVVPHGYIAHFWLNVTIIDHALLLSLRRHGFWKRHNAHVKLLPVYPDVLRIYASSTDRISHLFPSLITSKAVYGISRRFLECAILW